MARFIPLLPRRIFVTFAESVGALAYALDRRGREIALGNLECVFGDRFSPERRQEIARASYENFARTMLSLFWVTRLSPENYREWIQVVGYDASQDAIRNWQGGGGPVFPCAHFGNWEWANHGGAYIGYVATTVAEDFKNPRLTAIFKSLREHSGATLISQNSALLRMLRATKQGKTTSLMVDLNLPPTQASTIIEAFRSEGGGEGLLMSVPILHAVLVQRIGGPLIPATAEPLPDGGCLLRLHPVVPVAPDDTPQQIAQKCWDVFEPLVRERPELYLWSYKHYRYRPKDARRRYPAYSNVNGKFEKLRKEVARSAQG